MLLFGPSAPRGIMGNASGDQENPPLRTTRDVISVANFRAPVLQLRETPTIIQNLSAHCHVPHENDLKCTFGILVVFVYCGCRNYRTEVEEDEGTVIYRTLLFYNSVFLGRCEKKMYLIFLYLPLIFLRRSIILVGALLFYNSVFPHFSHISHFRSIINVSRAPFYN